MNTYLLPQVLATATSQNPMAVLLGCIDSRTAPELLFDTGIGTILAVRIAGNIVTPEVIGSLEISVKKLGAKLIVVKGHSNCGAVAIAMQNVMEDSMHTVTTKIQAVAKNCGCYPMPENMNTNTVLEKVGRLNTENSVADILSQSPYIREKVERKEIGIVSAYHDISTGKVTFEQMR
jgi:carbonic anhydrase